MFLKMGGDGGTRPFGGACPLPLSGYGLWSTQTN